MEYTAKGLVEYASAMLGLPYWYGTYGQIASEALYKEKLRQYPSQYEKWSKESFTKQFGKKVHDCSGLIKGYLMTEVKQGYPYNPATYNSKYDFSANGMIAQCKEQGSISSIPEVIGLLLWKNNHVGIYIGGGKVIEAKGHAYGVVTSKLSDTAWQKWGKLPWVKYDTAPVPEPVPTQCILPMQVLKKGDKCNQVSLLQLLLNRLGYKGKDGEDLEIDKSFGGNTDFAVRAFQRDHGLTVDGIVALKTWTVLASVSYA